MPVATAAQVRAAVRGLARPHRAAAAGGFAVLVAATAIGLLTAPVLGHVIDLVHQGRPASAITAPVTWLAVIALTQGVLTASGVSSSPGSARACWPPCASVSWNGPCACPSNGSSWPDPAT
nr:hypothetical protein GCM10020093_070430 [Planobispora longispora]